MNHALKFVVALLLLWGIFAKGMADDADLYSDNFYVRLGVAGDASDEEIKKAYRILAKEMNPDTNANLTDRQKRHFERAFRQVSEAYENLKDPQKRSAHDLYLKNKPSKRGVAPRQQATPKPEPEKPRIDADDMMTLLHIDPKDLTTPGDFLKTLARLEEIHSKGDPNFHEFYRKFLKTKALLFFQGKPRTAEVITFSRYFDGKGDIEQILEKGIRSSDRTSTALGLLRFMLVNEGEPMSEEFKLRFENLCQWYGGKFLGSEQESHQVVKTLLEHVAKGEAGDAARPLTRALIVLAERYGGARTIDLLSPYLQNAAMMPYADEILAAIRRVVGTDINLQAYLRTSLGKKSASAILGENEITRLQRFREKAAALCFFWRK